MFKYNITQAKEIINVLLLNNFYPVISYRRVQKESDELFYIRFSHSLRSAISCQRKWLINQFARGFDRLHHCPRELPEIIMFT